MWARSPKVAYALGEGNTILHFDGSALKTLGAKLPVVRRKYHPEVDPHPCELHLQTIWASSPEDVWVTGSPMFVLHFDGKRWAEVDVGAIQVIVPSDTRLTRAVVTPRIGPVWGTGAGDVWLRREEVEAVAKPVTGPFRPRRAYYRSTHSLLRFDGKKWYETDKKLPLVGDEDLGIRLTVPEVQVIGPTEIWTSFDKTLHRWHDSDWKPIAKLPKSNEKWTHWSGSGTGAALIYDRLDGLRIWEDNAWKVVASPPDNRDVGGKLGVTDDGAIVVRGPHYKRLFIGRTTGEQLGR